jgi:preprotein translocase subunit SecG
MQQVIIVVYLMVVFAMIGVILLQRSEGGGLGIGSGGGFMTSRGTANVLTRATAVLAALFFSISLLLSIMASMERKPTSIVAPGSTQQAPGGANPPLGGPGGGVLDRLRGGDQPATPAAPAPTGPQVPRSQ